MKSKFQEYLEAVISNFNKFDVDPKLQIGEKVFLNKTGAYYVIDKDNGKKFYKYVGLVLPKDWDDKSVKIINESKEELIDDKALEGILSKTDKLVKYIKKEIGDKKVKRQDLIGHVFDFAYENHVDLNQTSAEYIVDTVLIDELNPDGKYEEAASQLFSGDDIIILVEKVHDLIGDMFSSDDEEAVFNEFVKVYRKRMLR